MSLIEGKLLHDVVWREAELVNLKAACSQFSAHLPKGKGFRRAYLAMLYAHYEGFSKFAWEVYLIEISRCGYALSRLQPSLAGIFLASDITKLRNASADIMTETVFEFRGRLLDTISATYKPIETSNLWPAVLREVLDRLHVQAGFIDTHERALRSLVARRNDIAHGQNVSITDDNLRVFEEAVWDVFSYLVINISKAYDCRDFIR